MTDHCQDCESLRRKLGRRDEKIRRMHRRAVSTAAWIRGRVDVGQPPPADEYAHCPSCERLRRRLTRCKTENRHLLTQLEELDAEIERLRRNAASTAAWIQDRGGV